MKEDGGIATSKSNYFSKVLVAREGTGWFWGEELPFYYQDLDHNRRLIVAALGPRLLTHSAEIATAEAD